jgi:nucleoside-diphosphate-sugar epimerase
VFDGTAARGVAGGATVQGTDRQRLAGVPIAVTGVSGFFGAYLAAELAAQGATVVGVVRDPARRPELAELGVVFRVADLADVGALATGFRDTSAVIANAAVVPGLLASLSPRRHAARFFDTNVQGTRNVFDAAVQSGVRRIVLVSSVAVYRSNTKNVDESGRQVSERPGYGPMGSYSASKVAAERIARELAARHDLALTVVRPGQMFGAYGELTSLLRRVLGGRVAVVPYGLRIPLAYGGDVARAVADCVADDATIGRTYTLAGPARSGSEILRAWVDAGGPVARWRLPLPVPVRLSYDTTRAADELRWRHTDLARALRETLATEAAGQAPSAPRSRRGRARTVAPRRDR